MYATTSARLAWMSLTPVLPLVPSELAILYSYSTALIERWWLSSPEALNDNPSRHYDIIASSMTKLYELILQLPQGFTLGAAAGCTPSNDHTATSYPCNDKHSCLKIE